MFKRTKIKNHLIGVIKGVNQQKIVNFEKKLQLLHKKPANFFGVDKRFRLEEESLTETEINQSIDIKEYIQPYAGSLKLV